MRSIPHSSLNARCACTIILSDSQYDWSPAGYQPNISKTGKALAATSLRTADRESQDMFSS
jgi:hypothetical protein